MECYDEAKGMSGSPGGASRNLLLKASAERSVEFDCCVELLTPVDPADLNVWSLGIALPPDERLRAWKARHDESPADFRIVSAQPLSAEASMTCARDLGFDPEPRFRTLENPKNLTRLGVELVESLEAWEGSDRETVACFHSITALLQHVSTSQAYQFLHPFTAKVREFGASAHYHIDPRAHDDRDVARLETLFDAVREPEEVSV